jgi:hypothetical protein
MSYYQDNKERLQRYQRNLREKNKDDNKGSTKKSSPRKRNKKPQIPAQLLLAIENLHKNQKKLENEMKTVKVSTTTLKEIEFLPYLADATMYLSKSVDALTEYLKSARK